MRDENVDEKKDWRRKKKSIEFSSFVFRGGGGQQEISTEAKQARHKSRAKRSNSKSKMTDRWCERRCETVGAALDNDEI